MRSANNIILLIVVAIAGLLALVLGLQVGTQDFRSLLMWVGIGGALLYLIKGYQFTWQLILLLSFMGFSMRPIGFEISMAHVSFLLAGALAFLTSFRPSIGGTWILERSGIRAVQIMCVVWCVYGGLHFLWNHFDPVFPRDWSVKHALTRYFLAFSGPIVFFWYSLRPQGISLGKKWPIVVLWCLAIGLVFNLILRWYLMFFLGFEAYGDRGEFFAEEGMVYLPYINLIPGFTVLRTLGPIGVGFAYAFLTHDQWIRKQTIFTKLLVLSVLGLSFVGSLMSGGRGAVVLSIFYILLISVVRRKFLYISLGVAMVVAVFAFANVFSHWVRYSAPFAVSRSLQYFLIERGGYAASSIQSSSNWRKELFDRAIAEWKASPRVMATGRATLAYNEGDVNIRRVYGGFEAGIQSALRRGATHNMLTDLLIQYGIAGTVLYYLLLFAMIRFLWRTMRQCRDDRDLGVFSLFLSIHWITLTLYKTVGGAVFELVHFWMVVILTVGMRVHARELVDERALARRKRGGEEERPVRVATPGMVPAR